MKTLLDLYYSSVGKKIIVGLTGLCLCAYLVVHLFGNLLLFKDDNGAAFNMYAEILPSILIIRIIEIVLFAVFIFHILLAVILWYSNKYNTRPQQYEVYNPQANTSLSARTAFITGSIIYIFLIVHMGSFWFQSRFHLEENPSMYKLVTATFSNPFYSVFYIVAMFLLGLHLRHGFQSAFQTFGLRTQKYVFLIELIGGVFWLLIPAAFASMPIYFLFKS